MLQMDAHRGLMSGRLPPVLPPPSQALQATLNPSSAASATLAARTSLSHLTQAHIDNHHDYHQPEEDDTGDVTMEGDEPPKKKQKRNKPTLSCHECVDRKTKVRRFFVPLELSISRPPPRHLPMALIIPRFFCIGFGDGVIVVLVLRVAQLSRILAPTDFPLTVENLIQRRL